MKSIETVGVIGLGALGVLYADQFTQALGKDRVFVLADRQRTDRYRREGVWYNDELCDFNYADAAQITQPVDLLLFAVKFGGLDTAVDTCRHLVGPDTILLSVLNGITSEEVLGRAFGPEKVVLVRGTEDVGQERGQPGLLRPHRGTGRGIARRRGPGAAGAADRLLR